MDSIILKKEECWAFLFALWNLSTNPKEMDSTL
jgi:hypothetical protein